MITETINEHNIQELTGLYTEMFEETNFEEELNSFYEVLRSNTETCFLIKAADQYVAFIQLALRFDYVEGSSISPTAYVEALYVKEGYREKGLANTLLKKAEEWALQNNSRVLASDCEIVNTGSIAFHQKLGFTEANRIVCFIKPLV